MGEKLPQGLTYTLIASGRVSYNCQSWLNKTLDFIYL